MLDLQRIGLFASPLVLSDFIFGTGGGDVLAAQADGNLVFGLAGDDVLTSGFYDTYLFGGSGNDQLTTSVLDLTPSGADLDEVVVGVAQFGGGGQDTMLAELTVDSNLADAAAGSSVFLTGGSGGDTMTARAGATARDGDGTTSNWIFGDGGADVIDAQAFTFVVFGQALAENLITGGGDDDRITAVAENDGVTTNSLARNIIDGGSGDDTVSALAESDFSGFGGSAINVVTGGSGDDIIDARAVNTSIIGELAANTVDAGDGNDLVTASTFINTDSAGPVGTNTLIGGDGDDIMEAIHETFLRSNNFFLTFENFLQGDAGSDVLTGRILVDAEGQSSGTNLLEGGEGDDIVEAHVAASADESAMASNTLFGGAGNDTLSATASANARDIGGTAQTANLLDGGIGDDVLEATIADGSPGSSTLLGGDGDDELTVVGGAGNTLDGGADNDTLVVGTGDDGLTGGAGIDTFVFDLTQDQGTDTLFDFDRSDDRPRFNGLPDLGLPGLADDLDAITTVTDNGAGQDVVIQFDIGTTLVFKGAGTGTITSVADLVDDPDTQLLGDGSGPVPILQAGPLDFSGSVADAEILPHEADYLLAEGTLTFTFTADAINGRRFLFSKDSRDFDDGGHAGVYIQNGAVIARFQSETETFTATTGTLITAGTEFDLAVTFGAGGLKVFVDGQEEASNAYTGGLIGNQEPIVLGANQWSSGDLVANRLVDAFDGTITEFSLFDTVLL